MSYDVAGARRVSEGRTFRDIVSERLVAHGGWCMIPSAFAAEVVSASGCDTAPRSAAVRGVATVASSARPTDPPICRDVLSSPEASPAATRAA